MDHATPVCVAHYLEAFERRDEEGVTEATVNRDLKPVANATPDDAEPAPIEPSQKPAVANATPDPEREPDPPAGAIKSLPAEPQSRTAGR
jgi:hypothetical protein